ncbi:hypothetical protein AQ490_10115 [Wenjunlia vitaminophila]|uniref:DUF3152 domain-containing protein n=1 Tax=Wenjunlia vitaminophila TaxID=76728 RepID=A0A0T6LMG6_WENVI|nr:DUF3152 domain-containing protein [Wenjunlia vitaminophila]KRV47097.1 hypothetical protein AQ490_10115 [Wenjunlia vitaminophila]
MGRHKAPGRGRGERAHRAEQTAPRTPQVPGSGPVDHAASQGRTGEHLHARDPNYGQDHPQHPEPPFGAAVWAPAPGPGAAQGAAPRGAGQWDSWHTSLDARHRGAPPGPRPEDVEAFDAGPARVGGSVPDGRGAPGRPPAPGGPESGAPAPGGPTVRGAGIAGPVAERGAGASAPRGPRQVRSKGGARRSSPARTVTGLVAVAVLAVLAVSVAGQVSEAPDQESRTTGDTRRDDPAASRSGRQTERVSGDDKGKNGSAQPLTLHQRLSRRFHLPTDLSLRGEFTTVSGTAKAPGQGTKHRYRVDVEKGLPLDGELFAELVQETLNDRRSWSHGGEMTFERVSSGPTEFVITLASPATTDRWCAMSGLDTSIDKVSCDSASTERVMINAYRWAKGASTFGDDMLGYRQMLINHEVGHRLGFGHLGCPSDGALAPVMMQQTKFLSTGDVTCKPNPWPYPKE